MNTREYDTMPFGDLENLNDEIGKALSRRWQAWLDKPELFARDCTAWSTHRLAHVFAAGVILNTRGPFDDFQLAVRWANLPECHFVQCRCHALLPVLVPELERRGLPLIASLSEQERASISCGRIPRHLRLYTPHFGVCPACWAEPMHVGIAVQPGRVKLDNWFVCHDCRVRWCGGSGLLSWPFDDELPPADLDAAGIAEYSNVEPGEGWRWSRTAPGCTDDLPF